MKKFAIVLVSVVSSALAQSAHAENRQAKNCEIFVKSVQVQPNSHGSAGMSVVVKVGWLGNGEFIQKVGFYSHNQAQDLGNDPNQCYGTRPPADSDWAVQDPSNFYYGNTKLELGEYFFSFPISTGSVVGACPGYNFSAIGAFFVETNKNTYWVNPAMDTHQYFYFDRNGFNSIQTKGGTYQSLPTSRDDLRYYNALGCK